MNIPNGEIMKSKVQSFILSLYITYYIKIFKSGYDEKYLEVINIYVNNLIADFIIENIKIELKENLYHLHLRKSVN